MPTRDVTAAYLRQGAMALMGLTIALNITWPLVSGVLRDVVTQSAILTFAAAALLHAWGAHGPTYASRLASVVLLSSYSATTFALLLTPLQFSDRLGMSVMGVPLTIPLAWLMLLHPSLELARRATSNRRAAAVIAGCTAGSANLFVEPLLASDAYFTLTTAPGTLTVVLHSIAWCAVLSATAYAVLDIAGAPEETAYPGMPLLALLWVWLGNTVANAVPVAPFLAHPVVAATGFIGMAGVIVPAALAARRK